MSVKAALHSLAEITGSFGVSALNIFAPFSTYFWGNYASIIYALIQSYNCTFVIWKWLPNVSIDIQMFLWDGRTMRRTAIFLTDEQFIDLQALYRATGAKTSESIRRAIDMYLE